MKSPTLLHSSEALNFNLLQRNSIDASLKAVKGQKVSRRTSRKNLMIFSVVYTVSVAFVLYILAS